MTSRHRTGERLALRVLLPLLLLLLLSLLASFGRVAYQHGP